jgi:ADP-L-glycero-D-manno-heptose 6-epimerase
MPARFRGAYQYHTQADLQGLRRIGYQAPFTSLGDGVADYVAFLQHNHAQEIS